MKKLSIILISLLSISSLSSCTLSKVDKPSKGGLVSSVTIKGITGDKYSISNHDNPIKVYKTIFNNSNYFNSDNYIGYGKILDKSGIQKSLYINSVCQKGYLSLKGTYGMQMIDYKYFSQGSDKFHIYFKNGKPVYGGGTINDEDFSMKNGYYPPIGSKDTYMSSAHMVDRYSVLTIPEVNNENLVLTFNYGNERFDFISLFKASFSLHKKYVVLKLKCPVFLFDKFKTPNENILYMYCTDLKESKNTAKASYYINCKTGQIDYASFHYSELDPSDGLYKKTIHSEYYSKIVDVSKDIEKLKSSVLNHKLY